MLFGWPSQLGRAEEEEVTQVFAPWRAGREGASLKGPSGPPGHPTETAAVDLPAVCSSLWRGPPPRVLRHVEPVSLHPLAITVSCEGDAVGHTEDPTATIAPPHRPGPWVSS